MNLNLTIDGTLFRQAQHITGIALQRELFERALRALITQSAVTSLQITGLKNIGKVSEKLAPTEFESTDMPGVYQGAPLSLADMDAAVLAEAEKHQ
jgi:hypothetical protein